MTESNLHVVILAAGMGKRMRSALPKVLQPIGGRPMLAHVVATASQLGPAGVHVVFGHGGDEVRAAMDAWDLGWVHQTEQRGTGHAVQTAMPSLPDDARVLVLYGDTPLVQTDTLRGLLEHPEDGLVVLTTNLRNPTGYGRIIRDADGFLARIVEEKDANDDERGVNEVNTGIMAASAAQLRGYLDDITDDNAQGELYLTDVIALAADAGQRVVAHTCGDPDEVMGANDRWQLAELERAYQLRQARLLADAGATLADPARLDVRGSVRVGSDVFIDVNVLLEGDVTLGDRVRIGAGAVVRDSVLGPNTVVHPHCVLEEVRTAGDCDIGPFARLRTGTVLGRSTKVGNFVETKKATLGEGSKASHLTYLGDASIGKRVNVGAGTITCNYDGVNKSKTTIGDDAFIGSDTQLVAPVTVGEGATLGAGTTLVADAPANKLTISRARQVTIEEWERPKKK